MQAPHSSPLDTPITQLGEGIKREEAPPVPEVEEEPEPEAELNEKGDPMWLETPSFSDQFRRYPKLCRVGPLQVDVFNIVIPEEKTRLNELYSKSVPMEAPGLIMSKPETQAYRGGWSILVSYRKVLYKKLIPTA